MATHTVTRTPVGVPLPIQQTDPRHFHLPALQPHLDRSDADDRRQPRPFDKPPLASADLQLHHLLWPVRRPEGVDLVKTAAGKPSDNVAPLLDQHRHHRLIGIRALQP